MAATQRSHSLFPSSTRRLEHIHPPSSPVSRNPSSPSLHHTDSTTDQMFQHRFRAAKWWSFVRLGVSSEGRWGFAGFSVVEKMGFSGDCVGGF
ncbi:hypothetical protein HanIR_Chr02g0084541 [Helianthus annuus]|nr:hypothetical protein HanIR_Chr02g0084541 [Helianthus annuus]